MAAVSPAAGLDPATAIGPVGLTVADPERMRAFYETVLGLQTVESGDAAIALGGPDGATLVRLHPEPTAPLRDPRAPGLFHLAILLPTPRDLGHALLRVAAARWPLSGASDHLVSEALYLSDPEGNGIELYRDRPRDQWRRDASGSLAMDTLALDLDSVLAQAGQVSEPDPAVPPGTRMGHVHLQVSDLQRAEAFYHGVLGFDVTVRGYRGALFVSAGGYHHHVGLNTWNSAGSAPAAPGSLGLRHYEITLPDSEALANLRERLARAEIETEPGPGDATLLRDPFRNAILLRAR